MTSRWYYSSLAAYEECPAKFRYRYVDGLKTPKSPAMARGVELHKMCEDTLNGEIETPPELASIARILERLKANKAQPEKAWRLDSQWRPVASDSWLIGIIDVHFILGDVLHVYDFKSGRGCPAHRQQLELYALIGLATYPEVKAVDCAGIYIDTGKFGYKRTVTREEAEPAQRQWSARAERLFADSKLEATPGRGCWWCDYKDSMGGPCSAWKTA